MLLPDKMLCMNFAGTKYSLKLAKFKSRTIRLTVKYMEAHQLSEVTMIQKAVCGYFLSLFVQIIS